MTESEAYFIVNLVSGIGPVKAKRLRERFGSLDRALVSRESDLRSVEGIGSEPGTVEVIDLAEMKTVATLDVAQGAAGIEFYR